MSARAIPPARDRGERHVSVPASKSVANRELVLSAIATGTSLLELGPLDPGDDVRAMRQAVRALGHAIESDQTWRISVEGSAGRPPFGEVSVDAGDAGTVARFGAALAALGTGRATIDGSSRLRERPIAPLLEALRSLGAHVEGDRLPLTVSGPLRGGAVEIAGHESSQFASALLLVAPALPEGLHLRVTGSMVSAPYLELTIEALRGRGVEVERAAHNEVVVRPQQVRARDLYIPADASAATYPAAAGAILGGPVKIANVDARSAGGQSDVRFFDLLEEMGCTIVRAERGVTVSRSGELRGVDADLRDCSDVFPALAVVAAFAEGPSRLVGLAHTRLQESDRIRSVAAGLRACGAGATELPDGIRIEPAPVHGAVVDAAGDHRIAMAFSILGLAVPGTAIDGWESVSKTFPTFYDLLADLAGS